MSMGGNDTSMPRCNGKPLLSETIETFHFVEINFTDISSSLVDISNPPDIRLSYTLDPGILNSDLSNYFGGYCPSSFL